MLARASLWSAYTVFFLPDVVQLYIANFSGVVLGTTYLAVIAALGVDVLTAQLMKVTAGRTLRRRVVRVVRAACKAFRAGPSRQLALPALLLLRRLTSVEHSTVRRVQRLRRRSNALKRGPFSMWERTPLQRLVGMVSM